MNFLKTFSLKKRLTNLLKYFKKCARKNRRPNFSAFFFKQSFKLRVQQQQQQQQKKKEKRKETEGAKTKNLRFFL